MTVFDVLAEPQRRRILDLLADGEQPVNELVAALELSQPAVSKHLRVLRDAGLVVSRQQAQRRLYHVRPEPLREVEAWLAPYRRMWAQRLDDLERHLEDIGDAPRGAAAGTIAPSGAQLHDGRPRKRKEQ